MAGHSHWAGIKHKKGKADKQRSKIFSKLSKEITVAAKLGDKSAVKHFPAEGEGTLSGIIVETNENTGLAEKVSRVIDGGSLV